MTRYPGESDQIPGQRLHVPKVTTSKVVTAVSVTFYQIVFRLLSEHFGAKAGTPNAAISRDIRGGVAAGILWIAPAELLDDPAYRIERVTLALCLVFAG